MFIISNEIGKGNLLHRKSQDIKKNYTVHMTFTDLSFCIVSGILISTALEYGWKVIPVPEVNKFGTPVLKSIFYKAMNFSSHSRFHGFCNGDILFTEGRDHL